jgi:hypothetical protein
MNATGYGIDDWKSAHAILNNETFFAPLINKGIRLRELGIREGASLRFWRDRFGNSAIVSSGWKPSILFGQGLTETVRCYSEADK